jgi:flagellar hook protein FlgE
MSNGAGLSTKGLSSNSSGIAEFRMRGYDTTLASTVFWFAGSPDPTGVGYSGPGPLSDVVVFNIVNETIVEIPTVGAEIMPEMWGQENVAASQTDVALSAMVSMNFDTIKMTRSGSIVGISSRLTEDITAGTITIKITKNGTPLTLQLVHTSGTGSTAVQAAGIDTYTAGDLIGIQITTDGSFAPTTTDLEVWIEHSATIP